MDFEDFIEEVKFQMIELDVLEESIIFDWEDRARDWVDSHNDRRIIKEGDDITLLVKDEEICEEIAKDYYRAVKNQLEDIYWNRFKLLQPNQL